MDLHDYSDVAESYDSYTEASARGSDFGVTGFRMDLAKMHNDLKVTESVSADAILFWGRPFRIIRGEKIASAILERIPDPAIMTIAKRSPFGSIDMFSDNTDLLQDPSIRTRLKTIYK